jgi:hypothetical protein
MHLLTSLGLFLNQYSDRSPDWTMAQLHLRTLAFGSARCVIERGGAQRRLVTSKEVHIARLCTLASVCYFVCQPHATSPAQVMLGGRVLDRRRKMPAREPAARSYTRYFTQSASQLLPRPLVLTVTRWNEASGFFDAKPSRYVISGVLHGYNPVHVHCFWHMQGTL